MSPYLFIALAILGGIAFCQGAESGSARRSSAAISVTSPAVAEGAVLPATHCAFGGDVSLPLCIAKVPQGAAGLAVILDDPDAPGGTWAHWLLVDLPADTATLVAGADAVGLPAGTMRGKTSGGAIGYEGPGPPPRSTHRYRLRVYALAARPLAIDLARTWTRTQFEAAFAKSILGSGGISFRVTGPRE